MCFEGIEFAGSATRDGGGRIYPELVLYLEESEVLAHIYHVAWTRSLLFDPCSTSPSMPYPLNH